MGYRSAWWLVLPIILGAAGSAIVWGFVRRDDPDTAKWAMIMGIAITCVEILALGFGYADAPLGHV